MNMKSADTTLKEGKRPVCRLHRQLFEIEGRGERLSRLGSKSGRRRAIHRIVLEE